MSFALRQRGAALITVLMVFAIVSILLSSLILRSREAIERTSKLLDNIQSLHYALGGEALARQFLYRGLNTGPVDGHWRPQRYPIFEPEQGHIAMEIVDLQGRFNLNNLLFDASGATTARQVLEHLLTGTEQSGQWLNALIDWVDRDSALLPGGAEDFAYLNLATPYRTANRPLASTTELYLIAGAEPETLPQLMPWVTALPSATPINLNTAPPKVIEALFAGINGDQVVSARDSAPEGFDSLETFLQHAASAGLEVDTALVTLDSRYWQVRVAARFDEQTTYLATRLKMAPGEESATILDRDLGLPFEPDVAPSEEVDEDNVPSKVSGNTN